MSIFFFLELARVSHLYIRFVPYNTNEIENKFIYLALNIL